MTAEAERLLEALLSPTASTSEAVGEMGVDSKLLRVPKPSNPAPWNLAKPSPNRPDDPDMIISIHEEPE